MPSYILFLPHPHLQLSIHNIITALPNMETDKQE